MEGVEGEESLRGIAEVWKLIFAFADSMALKCAVELRIPDIIAAHGKPMTLSQIAAGIDVSPPSSSSSSSPDTSYLFRIMRLLVRKNVFAAHPPSHGGKSETLYDLTHVSKWLIQNSDHTLAPMVLMEDHPLQMAPWHCFSQCVREGGFAFRKAHGVDIWELTAANPSFNKLFNDGLASTNGVVMRTVVKEYGEEFKKLKSLVDVGGGTGSAVAEIVKAYPHIKGINFDLPHVVATAPLHAGVSHVGGDMFESIPQADAVFLKWVMHDWSDEECVRILKNCKKAIPERTGKVIIVEVVLNPEGKEMFDESRLVFDLLMIAHCVGGKERTEAEWKKVLKDGGFPRYNIIKIPDLPSIIQAFPY